MSPVPFLGRQGRDQGVQVVRLRGQVGDEAEKQALLLGEPDLFFTTPGYDGLPFVMLRLPEVAVRRLSELVTDAWRMRAPEEFLADLDQPAAGRQAIPGVPEVAMATSGTP